MVDKDFLVHQLRKLIESLPSKVQHKRNNVETVMFQYCFHACNGKTRYRGLFKHPMYAYRRCVCMNLRRMVLFQNSTFQRLIFALLGAIREAFCSIKAISRKVFTYGADCNISFKITILVSQNSKCASFKVASISY